MLEQIFLKILDMSRMASMVIVAVFIVRILLNLLFALERCAIQAALSNHTGIRYQPCPEFGTCIL